MLLSSQALAHPIPNLPIKTYFGKDRQATIYAEVDPRCFAQEPEQVEYMLRKDLDLLDAAAKESLQRQAAEYLLHRISFHLEPESLLKPEFTWSFTAQDNQPLAIPEDKVVLTGQWQMQLPTKTTGYYIKALPLGQRTVMFMNQLPEQELHITSSIFPGEESLHLDLKFYRVNQWQVFWELIRQGFLHVLPLGLDHILFVLGMFLLNRNWKPLLWQVSAFTLAHTLTLGLTMLGKISVSETMVEPVIAGSIAAVALENIFHPRYSKWRLLVVFVFGLVHGMGFAGALSELNLPTASLIVGLIGFNIGVEVGQLAVILLATVLTFWISNEVKYRKAIVIPVSLLISCAGLYWMVERLVSK
jgi:hypothetical protein